MSAETVYRLAHLVARRMTRPGTPDEVLEDRIGVALLACVKAARRFNPALGYAWTTFAAASARGEILRARHREPLVRGPSHAPERALRHVVSLSCIRNDEDGDPYEPADDRHADELRRAEAAAHARDVVGPALAKLPRVLRRVIECDLEGLDLAEAGARLGVSRETIRKRRSQALARLRAALTEENEP